MLLVLLKFFRNGIRNSAVCAYDVNSIEAAFSGPFQHQKTKDSIWTPFNSQNDFKVTLF
jgi:hypothetical protein